MKFDIYDTYATSEKGHKLHFDIFLPMGEGNDKALLYAKQFLKEVGETTSVLTLDSCSFCHTEAANPNIKNKLKPTAILF